MWYVVTFVVLALVLIIITALVTTAIVNRQKFNNREEEFDYSDNPEFRDLHYTEQLPVFRENMSEQPIHTWITLIHTADFDTAKYAIEHTWARNLPHDMRCDFMVGATKTLLDAKQHYICAEVEEGFRNILPKTLECWKLMLRLDSNWKYTIRGNNGTYFNVPILQQLIAGLPEHNVLAGCVITHTTQKPFVGGWCMIFSRDVVERLVELPPNKFMGDDVWLSHNSNTEFIDIPRHNWVKQPLKDISKDAPYYRLTVPHGYKRTMRIAKMYELHQYLSS